MSILSEIVKSDIIPVVLICLINGILWLIHNKLVKLKNEILQLKKIITRIQNESGSSNKDYIALRK